MTRDEYKKHKDLIDKWAAGAEIELRIDKNRQWIATDVPDWSVDCEYRIVHKPLERWALVDKENTVWTYFSTHEAARAFRVPSGDRIVHLKEVIDE